jgi:hypothetical protein
MSQKGMAVDAVSTKPVSGCTFSAIRENNSEISSPEAHVTSFRQLQHPRNQQFAEIRELPQPGINREDFLLIREQNIPEKGSASNTKGRNYPKRVLMLLASFLGNDGKGPMKGNVTRGIVCPIAINFPLLKSVQLSHRKCVASPIRKPKSVSCVDLRLQTLKEVTPASRAFRSVV